MSVDPGQPKPASSDRGRLAVVLTGGGARAAYQVGFLSCLARQRPDLRIQILTGVSAGAINASFLANHPGSFGEAVADLRELWLNLTVDQVFRVDVPSLARSVFAWLFRLGGGGAHVGPRVRGLVDTAPLRRTLDRALDSPDGRLRQIATNVAGGDLEALALTAVDYATGETVSWVEGNDVTPWRRPRRYGVEAELRVDHVMASSALPLFFPAVEVGTRWYGDGGIRLAAPLSPALHLGADRIVAISPRYRGDDDTSPPPATEGYPPPAQVAGVLLNAIFLDLLDQDARRAERVNRLLASGSAPDSEEALREVDLLVLRPSQDLGRLAGRFEAELPRAFRFLTRGLGTRETRSPDVLSLLMFQRDYLEALIEIGQRDAEARRDEIAALVDG